MSLSTGVRFTKHPSNQTVSQGNAARLGCAAEGLTEPDIVWMKDGEKLYSTDQMFLTLGDQHWETFHRYLLLQPEPPASLFPVVAMEMGSVFVVASGVFEGQTVNSGAAAVSVL